jgi:hypothetical protein
LDEDLFNSNCVHTITKKKCCVKSKKKAIVDGRYLDITDVKKSKKRGWDKEEKKKVAFIRTRKGQRPSGVIVGWTFGSYVCVGAILHFGKNEVWSVRELEVGIDLGT